MSAARFHVSRGARGGSTHHSFQAVLLHQLQRVLVARFEVVVLRGADLVSGHRADGVDDICEDRRTSGQTGAPW